MVELDVPDKSGGIKPSYLGKAAKAASPGWKEIEGEQICFRYSRIFDN